MLSSRPPPSASAGDGTTYCLPCSAPFPRRATAYRASRRDVQLIVRICWTLRKRASTALAPLFRLARRIRRRGCTRTPARRTLPPPVFHPRLPFCREDRAAPRLCPGKPIHRRQAQRGPRSLGLELDILPGIGVAGADKA